ncbi:unnamed protein product [Ostreobium quekettii]|uniref:Protein kinase domain-containing protein n=1 Tax=Ostreobium quekettii TaxID=121088 RepID=A0A8S1JEB0_9CHLO|nr:unnamed protein product [Ostreobium quekettii]
MKSGNEAKALAVLAKGLGRGAVPRELLETASSDIRDGCYSYRPWISASAAGLTCTLQSAVKTRPSAARQHDSTACMSARASGVENSDGPVVRRLGFSGVGSFGQDLTALQNSEQLAACGLTPVGRSETVLSAEKSGENGTTGTAMLSVFTKPPSRAKARSSCFGVAQRFPRSVSQPNDETGIESSGMKRKLDGDGGALESDPKQSESSRCEKKSKVQEKGTDGMKSDSQCLEPAASYFQASALFQPHLQVAGSIGQFATDGALDSRDQRKVFPFLAVVHEMTAIGARKQNDASKVLLQDVSSCRHLPIGSEQGAQHQTGGSGGQLWGENALYGQSANSRAIITGRHESSSGVQPASSKDAGHHGSNNAGRQPMQLDGKAGQSTSNGGRVSRTGRNDPNDGVGHSACQHSTCSACTYCTLIPDRGRREDGGEAGAATCKEARQQPSTAMQDRAHQASQPYGEEVWGPGSGAAPGSGIQPPSGTHPPLPKPAAVQPMKTVLLKNVGEVQLFQEDIVETGRAPENHETVYIKGKKYYKLEVVGTGGFSTVFKVLDPRDNVIYALKRCLVDKCDKETLCGVLEEVKLLKYLRREPQIVQLVDHQCYKQAGVVYMLQELGEIDLATLLHNREALRQAKGDTEPDWNFIRLLFEQMVEAVIAIHGARIVHSDLKPANFLMVKGALKLIDFGIAKKMEEQGTSIHREQQVGTLNYMAPETLVPKSKVGRPSDIWSLGCILYQMLYSRTPFQDIGNKHAKINAIVDPSHRIEYPRCGNEEVVQLMQQCLRYVAAERIPLAEVLTHAFVRGR